MKILRKLFRTKDADTRQTERDLGRIDGSDAPLATEARAVRLVPLEDGCQPYDAGNDYMNLFAHIPEVFWPIDYIARRISESHFDIKRVSDDSIVTCDRTGAARVLKNPNPVNSWRELVYLHFIYKLATGNTFYRAAMAESIGDDLSIFRWCSNYWVLPADKVEIVPATVGGVIPLFGIADIDEIIKGYRINLGSFRNGIIPPRQIWHDKDSVPMRYGGTAPFLRASSRLDAVKRNISNLVAVYVARNIIYNKRGAIGFVTANKTDETGTVALAPDEKKEILKSLNDTYGLEPGKSPYGFSDYPLSFVRTDMSIADLMPFDEVLEDSVKIAAIYGIPSVLVPRKDQSTFSNQDAAEKSVYTSVIIPAAKRFCEDLSKFLGLVDAGYYIDCDFSDVACLQVGLKEAAEVKKLTNEVCLVQFNCGLITINDWRAQMHQAALEGDIYNKVKFEMTPGELELVDKIIKSQTNSSKGEEKDGNNKEMPSDEDK